MQTDTGRVTASDRTESDAKHNANQRQTNARGNIESSAQQRTSGARAEAATAPMPLHSGVGSGCQAERSLQSARGPRWNVPREAVCIFHVAPPPPMISEVHAPALTRAHQNAHLCLVAIKWRAVLPVRVLVAQSKIHSAGRPKDWQCHLTAIYLALPHLRTAPLSRL